MWRCNDNGDFILFLRTIFNNVRPTLQNQLQNEINAKDNELKFLKEQTVSREEFINLQNELIRKNDKIKRLEEINAFFNELQEEQESYETIERTPPFKLEKKQHR